MMNRFGNLFLVPPDSAVHILDVGYKTRLLKLPRDHEAKVLSGNLLRLLPG